jgi:hypothetical protein
MLVDVKEKGGSEVSGKPVKVMVVPGCRGSREREFSRKREVYKLNASGLKRLLIPRGRE